jgi:hypothetical protein
VSAVRFTLDDAPFAPWTGQGVTVAVIDSGINANHPHVGRAERGVHVMAEGEDDDTTDRLGHGTAVAAAIREKAPAASLVAVRVFDRNLATSAGVLARAIVWAADHGSTLINLSLGTANPASDEVLREAVAHAQRLGAIIVSARAYDGVRCMPGRLDGVAGVLIDRHCARNEMRLSIDADGTPVFCASGLPRPIPGVPDERNLSGISFAVANVSGFFARCLEGRPDIRALPQLRSLLLGSRNG